MNKALAVSVIVLVAAILGMSSLAPYVIATHDESHKSPLYRQPEFCLEGEKCTIVIDTNRNGLCDAEDKSIQVPSKVWATLEFCPSPPRD